MSSHHAEPRGVLRVSAPLSFGLSHLSPLIAGFMQVMPKIEIDLDLNDRTVDLVAEGFDMAVRIGMLSDSSMVARKLMDVSLEIVASPAYLAKRGTPTAPADIKVHDCLLFRHGRGTTWLLRAGGRDEAIPVTGTLRANNGEILRDAAIAGARSDTATRLPDQGRGCAGPAGKRHDRPHAGRRRDLRRPPCASAAVVTRACVHRLFERRIRMTRPRVRWQPRYSATSVRTSSPT